jgi:SnoaL-like domain
MRYAFLCYDSDAVVGAWTSKQEEEVFAKHAAVERELADQGRLRAEPQPDANERRGHHPLGHIVRSLDEYNMTWDFFYDSPKGPISFVPSELAVTAGTDVAFASCLIHCDGTSAGPLDLRLTIGLRKLGGEWVVTHEHHSVPTIEERFLPPGTEN